MGHVHQSGIGKVLKLVRWLVITWWWGNQALLYNIGSVSPHYPPAFFRMREKLLFTTEKQNYKITEVAKLQIYEFTNYTLNVKR